MSPSVEQLIAEIHATPTRIVLAVAGGGSGAIAALLEVPGASRTVLEVAVPYCEAAMIEWLAGPPDQSCSLQTARAMAAAAFRRARQFGDPATPLAGVAATASLATDRPKRGSHRVHLAMRTDKVAATWSLQLHKEARSRAEEERLVTRLVLNVVAEACGVARRLELDLLPGERVEVSRDPTGNGAQR